MLQKHLEISRYTIDNQAPSKTENVPIFALLEAYPFMFNFKLRQDYFKITSFDQMRNDQNFIHLHEKSRPSSLLDIDKKVVVKRIKFRIHSREKILEDGRKAMKKFGPVSG